jgi:single-stranded DNA-binding protein
MINALLAGQLASQPKSGTSASGVTWANCVIRCPVGNNRETGDAEVAFVSLACFGTEAEKLARMDRGDAISATGNIKQSSYTKDGVERHGLSMTASAVLTAYQVKRRRGDSEGKAKREHVHDSDREANRAYDQFARGVKQGSTRALDDFGDEQIPF